MTSDPKLQAYALWLQERGLRFPRLRVVPSATRCVIFDCGDAALTEGERTLLDKMIAAMKLGAVKARIVSGGSGADADGVVAIVALRDMSERTGEFEGHVLTTLHPRELLRDPAQKRVAWTDLQLVMERLT